MTSAAADLSRRSPSRHRTAVALTVALATAAVPAAAQGPITVARFDFNFSNPGARSLGFGGAFVALADDATAAFANPAGLVQLTRTELALEARRWDRSAPFLAGGRESGQPTGIGRDTVDGLRFGRSESAQSGPSFAAFVVPRDRWAFSIYAHRTASFELRSEAQRILSVEDDEDPFTFGIDGSRERVDLELATVGLVAAFRMNEGASFGLALTHGAAELATRGDYFFPDAGPGGSPYAENHFLPEQRISTTAVSIDDGGIGWSAGARFRLSELVHAGLVYRRGARFDGTSRIESGPGVPGERFEAALAAAFNVPDVLAAGLSYRSRSGAWTVAGELDRVGYADLLEIRGTDDVEAFTPVYDDGWEAHLGAEYAWLGQRPVVAVRLGAWLESGSFADAGDEREHVSAGVGFAAERFQLDLGVDLSTELDTFSLSFVYAF